MVAAGYLGRFVCGVLPMGSRFTTDQSVCAICMNQISAFVRLRLCLNVYMRFERDCGAPAIFKSPSILLSFGPQTEFLL